MKEKASPKRLKGTVLFTVVSVMMVLIVFLMGTLALAATASNRAASNYQKAQTEATARTVIDSVVQAVNTNADIRATVAALGTGGSTPVTVAGSDGIDVTATITNVGTQPMFDEGEQEWKDGKLFQVTTTVEKTKAETTYSAYFSAVIPQTLAPSAGGGAFVSLGDLAGTEIGTGGYITGGTYININGDPNHVTKFNEKGTTIVDAPFYLGGDMEKNNQMYFHYRLPGDYFVVTGNFTDTTTNGWNMDFEGFTGTIASYDDIPFMYVGKKLSIGSQGVNFGQYSGNPSDPTNVPFNIYCGTFGLSKYEAYFNLYGDLYCFEPGGDSSYDKGTTSADSALYKWASSTLTNDNGDSAMGNWYSAGNVSITSPKPLVIEGDLRVVGDVTINADVTVGGDLVVGGTLTIESAKTVKCGNLYAGTVTNTNGGSIECNGTVKAGKYDGAEAQKVTVNSVQKTYTWYTDLTSSAQLLEEYEDGRGRFKVTVNYTKHTVVTVDGVETSRVEDEPGVYENEHISVGKVDGAYPSVDEIVAGITDGNYTKIPEHDSEANAEVVTNTGLDKAPNTHSTIPPKVGVAGAYDVEGVYGKIYPEAYNAANIENTVLTKPTITDYTNYPDELSDLGPGIYSGDHFVIPEYTDTTVPKETRDGKDLAVVTESCVLSGPINCNIYIDPESGPITVVLKDVTMGNTKYLIVVNDDKDVTLFVQGTLTIPGGGIITKDYLDLMGATNAALVSKDDIREEITKIEGNNLNWVNDLTIPQNSVKGDKTYPNVIIYGEASSAIKLGESSNTLVTALIRAPLLTFNQVKALPATKAIDYVNPAGGIKRYGNGTTGSNADKNGLVGVIGQLVAQHIELKADANWGLIFINAGTPKKCTCGCAACIDPEHPTKCTCKSNGCTCPDCICTGDLAGYGTPDAYTILNYDFY